MLEVNNKNTRKKCEIRPGKMFRENKLLFREKFLGGIPWGGIFRWGVTVQRGTI